MNGSGISVLILTLNEEVNLHQCLESVRWCDDVVILDSYSSDETLNIAVANGVRVMQRKFDTYAGQRNFGLKNIQYKNPWLLMLDADERVPDDLRLEMIDAVTRAPADVTLFCLRRRDHLFGRWIRRSSGYPTWFGRLMKIGHVWIERPINEEFRTSGEMAQLRAHLDHYPFNKGFSAWIAKHDRYSSMEAELLMQERVIAPRTSELLATDPLKRRKAFKYFAYKLPWRPVLVFVGLYVLKLGFMDGRAGLTFALLRSWYEYMIDCKNLELRRRKQGLSV